MKHRDENLSRVETITTIIVNLATIVSWIFTFVTAATLIAQPQPIVIPGVFELDKPYILTFLASIFFGYLQVLRQFWRNSRLIHLEAESSFSSYLYMSIVKFKRPLVIVGFVIIIVIIVSQVDISAFLFFFSLIAIIGGGYFLYLRMESPSTLTKIKLKLDDEYSKRWLKRIRKQLYQNGYTHTANFLEVSWGIDEANLAIQHYFYYYEFEQDLVYSEKYFRKGLDSYQVCEIRFPHIASQIEDE